MDGETTPRSWKLGCKTADCKEWAYNALRFSSRDECLEYGNDLYSRWMALKEYAPHGCGDEPTHEWKDGKLVKIGG